LPIDVGRAREQHASYIAALASLGCTMVELGAEPELPDSVFVEDTAVVLDEVAVITRPGAASRRPEVEPVARALAQWRPCVRIESPGTLDGGDVMAVGRDLYVGRSGRSNDTGIARLADATKPYGYRVIPVSMRGCLHLKSAVTCLDPETLLVNDEWVDRAGLPALRFVAVAAEEPHAANALRVGETVLHAASGPRTGERIEAAGYRVLPIDVSEMEKAEGAVTCCSVIFET
jgi:dimethylargininase